MDFRLIFVMDILNGEVVHAKRGERDRYKPIHHFSTIVSSSDPLRIIQELKPQEVYIADLNRLMNTADNQNTLKELRNRATETQIMLDYGISVLKDLKFAADAGIADNFVLGTETTSVDLLEEASRSDISVSVSVDLFNNKVLTRDKRLKINPLLLIKKLNEYPIQDVIVLDLDRVGTKSGIDFDFLARAVACSEHNILCGGGVKSCEDITKMEEIGVKGALVATALHDRSIPASAIRKENCV